MKQGQGRGTSDGEGCGCDAGSDEKARYTTQVSNRERPAKPPLEQPRRHDGLAGIPEAIEQ
jgi:hypothetical protein